MEHVKKNLEKKKAYVAELTDKIKNSSVGVLISYKGIDSREVTSLRKEMRDEKLDYFVVKNTMMRLASKDAGFDFSDSLVGTTAVALGQGDLTVVSKILLNYAKKLEGKTEFKIKTGFVEGEVVDSDFIVKIGSLPTKQELLGQLIFMLLAPIRGLLICLSEIAKNKSESSV